MGRLLRAVGALAATVTLAACGRAAGAAPEVPTLTVALPAEAGAAERAEAEAFEALVEGLSGSALSVEVAAEGEVCGEVGECLRALQEGSITVAPATTVDVAALFTELQVLDVPYLFENAAVAERVFDGPFYARLRDALVHRTGLRPVAFGGGGGWRTLATTRRQIRAPDDVRGLALWAGASPIEVQFVETFGAAAASSPIAGLSNALATGALEGATMRVADLVDRRLHEHLRYVTLDRHSYVSMFWLVNDAAYRALSDNLRQVVQAGFAEIDRLRRGASADREAEAVRAFEAAGGTVLSLTGDEQKRFLMAAGRVATGYVEAHGPDWLVWLEGAIAEAEREIELAQDGRDGGRP